MKKDYSRIVALVDESGSMSELRSDTVGGLNEFISKQKEAPGEADFSLFFFDKKSWGHGNRWNTIDLMEGNTLKSNIRRTIRDRVPIKKVAPIESREYNPYGTTPLLDALGLTIDELGRQLRDTPEKQRPEHVIVCVITDGLENSSVQFSRERVREMIETQTEVYNWKFVFLGANQDSFTEAGNLGFNLDYVANYSHTGTGTRYASKALNYVATNVRSGLGKSTSLRNYEEHDYEAESST